MEKAKLQRYFRITLSDKEHKFLAVFGGAILSLSAFNVVLQLSRGELMNSLTSIGLILMIGAYLLSPKAAGPDVEKTKLQDWMPLLLVLGVLFIAISAVARLFRWLA